MYPRSRTALLGVVALSLALACSKSGSSPAPAPPDASAPGGVTVVMNLAADLDSPAHFFDYPWPSDLRLASNGTPDLVGMPNPLQGSIIEGLRTIAEQNTGFPVVPVAWFQFTDALAPRGTSEMIPAVASSPVLLIDVDPSSPTRGALTPTIAQTLVADAYVPANVLAIGPLPGFILDPKREYAYVVLRSANDATGAPLGVAPGLFTAETDPTATDPVSKSLAPLWPALAKAGVAATDVAAATVFTTGDVVQDLHDMSELVRQNFSASITNIGVDTTVLDTNDRFCEVQAQVTYPQFQSGSPPYDTGGLFTLGANGVPEVQGQATVPLTFTIPKQPMPTGGFPTILYFHGTGGVSDAIADRGVWHPTDDPGDCAVYTTLDTWNGVSGCNAPGQGPGWTMAARGFCRSIRSGGRRARIRRSPSGSTSTTSRRRGTSSARASSSSASSSMRCRTFRFRPRRSRSATGCRSRQARRCTTSTRRRSWSTGSRWARCTRTSSAPSSRASRASSRRARAGTGATSSCSRRRSRTSRGTCRSCSTCRRATRTCTP
jgi:hypothetical protein